MEAGSRGNTAGFADAGRGHKPRIQAAFRSWGGQENKFFPRASRNKHSPADNLII